MKTQTIIAIKFLLIMTILTGVIYPLFMTGMAQLIYPSKANGSLIIKNGSIVGSELIGQKFDSTIYFWSRPSATLYSAIPSGGSNYGPTSDTLKKLSEARRLHFAEMNFISDRYTIPNEMLFASASGLDPHITPQAALMQSERICITRKFDNNQKERLINEIKNLTESPQLLVLGEPRINVLMLNLELDKIENTTSR